MRRLALLLWLCATAAQGATTFGFAWRETWASPITPAYDSGWEETSFGIRGYLTTSSPNGLTGHHNATGGYNVSGHSVTLTQSSANQALSMQFISPPLASGVVFQSGVTTVTLQVRAMEEDTSDDVNQCIIGIRIIDDDGSTVNATLLSVANYGTTTVLVESGFDLQSAQGRNKTCANGDTVTANYTSTGGEYLVVEMGFQNDGATGVIPRAMFLPFDNGGKRDVNTGTDAAMIACPANETALDCYGVLTFSNTITVLTEPNPGPTRLYFPWSEVAAVSPATTSGIHDSHTADWTYWQANNELQRRRLVKVKGVSSTGEGQQLDIATAIPESEIDRQYVSDPMVAGITFTALRTTVSGQIMAREGASGYNLTLAAGVRIFSEDGTTLRINLMPVDHYWQFGASFSGTTAGTAGEFQITNANNETMFKNALVSTTYTTVAGDRLVVEIGVFQMASSTTGAWGHFTYGETAADCDQTDSTSTTQCSPWIEFSNDIDFTTDIPAYKLPPPWIFRLL